MRPHALLLDFDGLICDTERAAFRSWQELYARHGLEFRKETWAQMAGSADGEDVAIEDLSRRHCAPTRGELEWRRSRKEWLSGQEPLRDGVAALLGASARLGITVGVVSSSPRSWVHGHLARLAIGNRFSAVVTGDAVLLPKPSPDLHHLALDVLGVSRQYTVAFEDSAPGVRAAKVAGLRCVAVPSAVGSRSSVAGADLILDSVAEYRLDDTEGAYPA